MIENVAAVILAGGKGTRLRPVMPNRQKVIVPVQGRPFLTILLKALAELGLKQVVLCTGYRSDQVRAAFGTVFDGLSIVYSREEEPLGTGGALKHALPLIRSEILLVLNGDSFLETDLSAYSEWFLQGRKTASLLLTRVPDTSRFGRVELGATGEIIGFHEKGPPAEPGWINAGVYLFKREVLEGIPEGKYCSLEHEVFPALTERGELSGYCCHAPFIDIGTPDDYQLAQSFFRW